MTFRWMLLATLIVAFTLSMAAQDDASAVPGALYPSQQNNALVETTNLDNGISALEHSAPAHQNSEEEMLSRVAEQTSPAHESGWNWASTICAIALGALILGIFEFRRRTGPDELHRRDLRRAA